LNFWGQSTDDDSARFPVIYKELSNVPMLHRVSIRWAEVVLGTNVLGCPHQFQHSPGMSLERNPAASLADQALLFVESPLNEGELAQLDSCGKPPWPAAYYCHFDDMLWTMGLDRVGSVGIWGCHDCTDCC